jgi:hypothetical protein
MTALLDAQESKIAAALSTIKRDGVTTGTAISSWDQVLTNQQKVDRTMQDITMPHATL